MRQDKDSIGLVSPHPRFARIYGDFSYDGQPSPLRAQVRSFGGGGRAGDSSSIPIARGFDEGVLDAEMSSNDLLDWLRRESGGRLEVNIASVALDEGESIFLARQLLHIRQKIAEAAMYPLAGLSTFKLNSEAGPGSRAISVPKMQGTGAFHPYSGGRSPERVGAHMGEDIYPVGNFIAAYGWDVFELLAAIKTGTPLSSLYARLIDRAYQELLNRIIFNGWPSLKLHGLKTAKYNRLRYSAGPFNGVTAADIRSFSETLVTSLLGEHGGSERYGVVLCPTSTFTTLIIKNQGTADNTMSYVDEFGYKISRAFGREQKFVHAPELNGITDAGENLMVFCDPSDTAVEMHVPMRYMELDPQQSGADYLVPVVAKVSSLIFYDPHSAIGVINA